MSIAEAEIIPEIIKMDTALRQTMKDWAVIHGNLFDKPSLWQRIKKLLTRSSESGLQSLLEHKRKLNALDSALDLDCSKIQELCVDKRGSSINSIQKQYLEELRIMSITLYGLVSGLKEINDHLIIEKKNGNTTNQIKMAGWIQVYKETFENHMNSCLELNKTQKVFFESVSSFVQEGGLSKSKIAFPEKSGKSAMLYITVKGNSEPQSLQMTATVAAGAPIFFTKGDGCSVGRCGLPKVEFPPEDIGLTFILDNVSKFISLLNAQGLKYEIESDNLCETDHNELVKYLSNWREHPIETP